MTFLVPILLEKRIYMHNQTLYLMIVILLIDVILLVSWYCRMQFISFFSLKIKCVACSRREELMSTVHLMSLKGMLSPVKELISCPTGISSLLLRINDAIKRFSIRIDLKYYGHSNLKCLSQEHLRNRCLFFLWDRW